MKTNQLEIKEREGILIIIIPRRCEQSRYRDSSRPSSTADPRSRGFGPRRRWRAAAEAEAGRRGPTWPAGPGPAAAS